MLCCIYSSPEGHAVVGSPANYKAENQHSGNLDCVELCLVNNTRASEYPGLPGPLEYNEDNGHVAGQHDQKGHEEGHAEDKQEVEKFLKSGYFHQESY